VLGTLDSELDRALGLAGVHRVGDLPQAGLLMPATSPMRQTRALTERAPNCDAPKAAA